MKKILVPTDFSVNSKSGIRFAIHWADQQPLQLVFIHVLHIWSEIQWSDSYFTEYARDEENSCKIKLEKFITGIYRNMNVTPGNHSFLIVQGINAGVTIMDYCRNNKDIDFICISTRGAGKFNRILGTNTGNLITKSEVPVLAVPKTYRVTNIKKILYAADLQNYSQELKKVLDFSLPFKASVDVLHIAWPHEIHFDKETIESAFKKQYKYTIKIHFVENDPNYSLIGNLQNQIKLRKPSVVIMFTNQ